MTTEMEYAYYKVLGLDKGASEDDIKKSFRNLAKQFHPDKNSEVGAEERFKEISAAYDTLKDGAKRKLYDMEQHTDTLRRENEKREKEREAKGKSKTTTFTNGNGNSTSFSFTTNNGTNFTFQSTFSSSSDKENNKSNSSDKKKKDGKSGARQYRGSKTFSFSKPDWDDDTTDSKPKKKGPKVSFKFSFGANPMEGYEDVFEDFLEDPFLSELDPFSGVGAQQKQRRKKTANPEEEMWDWTKPLFGKNKAEELYEDEKSMKGPAKDYKPEIIRFPCTYCSKMFTAERVKRHEKMCQKMGTAKDEVPIFHRTSKSEERERSPSPSSQRKTWREENDAFINSKRNARRTAKENGFTEPDPTRDTDFIKCRYCYREFSKMAADRHMMHCDMRSRDGTEEKFDPLSGTGKNYYSRQYMASTPSSSFRSSPEPLRRAKTPRAGGFSNMSTPRTGRDYMDEPLDSTGSGLHSTPRKGSKSNGGPANMNGTDPPQTYMAPISNHEEEFDREAATIPSPETAYERYQKRYYSGIDSSIKSESAWKPSVAYVPKEAPRKPTVPKESTWKTSESYVGKSQEFGSGSHDSTPTPSDHSSRSGSKDGTEYNKDTDDARSGPTINISSTGNSSRFLPKKTSSRTGRSFKSHKDLADVPEDSESRSFSRKQQKDVDFSHARRIFSGDQSVSSEYASRYLNSKPAGTGSGSTSYTSSTYMPTGISSSNYSSSSMSTTRYGDDSYRSSGAGNYSSSSRSSRIDASGGPPIHIRTSSEPNYNRPGGSTSNTRRPVSTGYTGTGLTNSYTRPASSRTYSAGYSTSVPSYSNSTSFSTGSSSYSTGSSSGSYSTGSGSGSYSSSYGLPTYSNLADSYAGRVPSYRTAFSTSVA